VHNAEILLQEFDVNLRDIFDLVSMIIDPRSEKRHEYYVEHLIHACSAANMFVSNSKRKPIYTNARMRHEIMHTKA
jgi:hypothetical protein